MIAEIDNQLDNHRLRKNYKAITKLCSKEYLTEELTGKGEERHYETKKLIDSIMKDDDFLKLINVDVIE